MLVVKRDGRREHVAFDKITARIKKLCYGFDPKHVDPAIVAQKVVGGVYDGVTTKQLDDLASETAAFLTTQHPDYGRLAARIAVSNLHKETEKSFSETMCAAPGREGTVWARGVGGVGTVPEALAPSPTLRTGRRCTTMSTRRRAPAHRSSLRRCTTSSSRTPTS